ncbi:EF-hand domain-containing protein [Streptomyces sp. AD681]|uniref:EF-hand domain-containing protein n=1 Tax=Streptomyces sp. AD681 TaxID=3019069 RepID=UPI002FDE1C64
MASEFRRTKVQAMFDVFDTDGNGFLGEADFEALATRWSRLPRVAASPELALRVRGVMMGWWQELSAAADASRPDRVSMDELMTVVE